MTASLPQFLPQDKVVMFARLTPTELLKETEKSIGDGELKHIHKKLIETKEVETDTSHVRVAVDVARSFDEISNHAAACGQFIPLYLCTTWKSNLHPLIHLHAAQAAQVLEAELTKHKAANAGIERDVARFQEQQAINRKVHCICARHSPCR